MLRMFERSGIESLFWVLCFFLEGKEGIMIVVVVKGYWYLIYFWNDEKDFLSMILFYFLYDGGCYIFYFLDGDS